MTINTKSIESTIRLLRNTKQIPLKFKSISDIYIPTDGRSSDISYQESISISNVFSSVRNRRVKEAQIRKSRLKQIFSMFSENPRPKSMDYKILPYPEKCKSGLELSGFATSMLLDTHTLMILTRQRKEDTIEEGDIEYERSQEKELMDQRKGFHGEIIENEGFEHLVNGEVDSGGVEAGESMGGETGGTGGTGGTGETREETTWTNTNNEETTSTNSNEIKFTEIHSNVENTISTDSNVEKPTSTDWNVDKSTLADSTGEADSSHRYPTNRSIDQLNITDSYRAEFTGEEIKAVLWGMANRRTLWDFWREKYAVEHENSQTDVSVSGIESLNNNTRYIVTLLPQNINVESFKMLLNAQNTEVVLVAAWKSLYGDDEGLSEILKGITQPWTLSDESRKKYTKIIDIFTELAAHNLTKTVVGAGELLYFNEAGGAGGAEEVDGEGSEGLD